MLAKIVYKLSDGQVSFGAWSNNLDGISPVYDSNTHAVVVAEVLQDLMDNPSRYFYVDGGVVKDHYGTLELSSNQTDTDGDGIQDMASDGIALATYTIKKKDVNGNYATGAGDNDSIAIVATRGKLSVRAVSLVNGQATFTLKSIAETVSIIVSVSHQKLGRKEMVLQLRP